MGESSWEQARFTPEEGAEWRSLGFSVRGAENLRIQGWGPRTARRWVEAGFPPDGQLPKGARRGPWPPIMFAANGWSPEESGALYKAGVGYPGPGVRRWVNEHSIPELADLIKDLDPDYNVYGLDLALNEPDLTVDRIRAANKLGLDPGEIARWFQVFGWCPDQWLAWRSAGYREERARGISAVFKHPHELAPWTEIGFSPESAMEFNQKGVSLAKAQEYRYQGILSLDLGRSGRVARIPDSQPWSWAFSRSRGVSRVYAVRKDITDRARLRVSRAVRDLGAPTRSVVKHRESPKDFAVFLDGGAFGQQAYGFGGLTGNWVFGIHAFALVCDRAGYSRPRNLDAPSREELNAAWDTQRQHPEALDARLARLEHVGTLADLDGLKE
jgi:hypothetical protein